VNRQHHLLTVLLSLFPLCAAVSLAAEGQPWWDHYLLVVQNADAAKIDSLHADGTLNAQFGDPSWGIYGQKVAATGDVPALMHKAGLKFLSYYEAYGETTDFTIELGSPGTDGEHSVYRTAAFRREMFPASNDTKSPGGFSRSGRGFALEQADLRQNRIGPLIPCPW